MRLLSRAGHAVRPAQRGTAEAAARGGAVALLAGVAAAAAGAAVREVGEEVR